MIKFICRILGIIILSSAFILIVVDGTNIIANSDIIYTTLRDVLQIACRINDSSWCNLSSITQSTDTSMRVMHWFMGLPAALHGFVIGCLLLIIGQKHHDVIGFDTRH